MAVTFTLIAGISVLAVIEIPGRVANQLMLQDTERRAELWKRRVLSALAPGGGPRQTLFGQGLRARAEAADLAALTRVSDIYRLKIFDHDGNIVWSSRPGEIGTVTSNDYFFDTVARGNLFSKLARKSPDQIDAFDLHATSITLDSERIVAEVYAPVLGGGQFAGAIEFYSDISEPHAALVSRVRVILIILFAGGLTISSLGGGLTMRINRRRLNEMNERAEQNQALMSEQVRLSREVQLLSELNQWLQSAATLNELFSMVSQFMTHLFGASEGAIFVYSNSRDVLDGWVAWNGAGLRDHIRPDACWGLRRGRTYVYGMNEIDFACEHAEPHDGRPYFCFPILAHGETVGLMHLRAAPGESFSQFRECQKLAQLAAEQISMAISNVRMRDQLRDQSIRDPLTGLYNRRHMTDTLRRHLQNAKRDETPLSLLSLDVDHFKLFNDNHGHDAGDIVLRAVADVMQNHVSGDEIACRPGGEEFAVVLPGQSPDAAMARAEDLRTAIEALKVPYAGNDLPRITVSIGVAACPDHGETVQDLISAADAALYKSKDHGRNRVCSADPEPPETPTPARPTVVDGNTVPPSPQRMA